MAHESPIPEAIPFRTLGPMSGAVKGLIAVLILIGVAAALMAGMADDTARFWQSLLVNWLFWSSVALGMVLFAVSLHLTNATWAWSVKRFALGGVAFLPISLLLLFVVFFGAETYFHHWLHVEGDPVIDAKAAWLNLPGLVVRDIVAVLILYGLSVAFAYHRLRPDVYGCGETRNRPIYGWLTRNFTDVNDVAVTSRRIATRIGVVLGILFAILWGVIAVDFGMSLSPHWFSTMFPVAFFWTAFHGGVAATLLAVVLLRRPMRLEPFITGAQFHDLGKMLFAFSVFWMYLQWGQYLVIWYGLLPWDQEWFIARFQGGYQTLVQIVVTLVFLVPFFGLLTKPPKRIPAILAFFASIVLVGHWLERFVIVVPSIWEGSGIPLGFPEIGMTLGFLGLFMASYMWFVSTFPMLPSPVNLASQEQPVVRVAVKRG